MKIARGILLVFAVFALVLIYATPASAQFAGICGQRDGCGVPANDFRVKDPVSDEEREASRAQNAERRQYVALLDQANGAQRAGNVEQAIRFGEQALAVDDRQELRTWIANMRAILYSRAADTALRNGEYSNALALYENALRNPAFLPPELPQYLNWIRGAIELRNGNRREAIRRFRLAINTPWITPENRAFVAQLEAQEAADARWDRALADAYAANDRGMAQLAAGDVAAAARVLAEAAALAPGDRLIGNNSRRASAEVALLRGDYSGAIRLLEEAFDDAAAQQRLIQVRAIRDAQTSEIRAAIQDTARRLTVGSPEPATAVDARNAVQRLPSYLPKLPEVENSPGLRQWTAGMHAVIAQDWSLAWAYFEGARLQDPGNAALQNAVLLAAWMKDQNHSGPGVAPPPSTRSTSPDEELRIEMENAFREELIADLRTMLGLPEKPRRLPEGAPLLDLISFSTHAQAQTFANLALIRITQNQMAEAVSLLDQAALVDPSVPNYAATAEHFRQRAAERAQPQQKTLEFIR